MKWLIIVFLVLASSAFADQAKPTGTKDSKANNIAEAAQQESGKANPPPISTLQNSPNTDASTQNRQSQASNGAQDPPVWVDFLNAISTGIIAFFTICLFVGLVVQICTSRSIERAWIMAEIQPDPEKPSDGKLQVFEGSSMQGESTAAMNAVLNCSNAGKTPGWIEETIAKFEMVKTLPDTPNFESAQSIKHPTIPLGMAEGGAVPYSQKIQWTPIAKGHQNIDEMAVIYGRIVYRDIFGKRRTTTFGYKVRPHGRLERLEGHPEYNKNT